MGDALHIIVCGGRDFSDVGAVWGALDRLLRDRDVASLTHGDCPTGADKIADAWARNRGITIRRYPADWRTFGKAAGPKRNALMLAETLEAHPDAGLVAFPGGRGTADMVRRARAAGVTVWEPCKTEVGDE